jgi:hypothetical protein
MNRSPTVEFDPKKDLRIQKIINGLKFKSPIYEKTIIEEINPSPHIKIPEIKLINGRKATIPGTIVVPYNISPNLYIVNPDTSHIGQDPSNSKLMELAGRKYHDQIPKNLESLDNLIINGTITEKDNTVEKQALFIFNHNPLTSSVDIYHRALTIAAEKKINSISFFYNQKINLTGYPTCVPIPAVKFVFALEEAISRHLHMNYGQNKGIAGTYLFPQHIGVILYCQNREEVLLKQELQKSNNSLKRGLRQEGLLK